MGSNQWTMCREKLVTITVLHILVQEHCTKVPVMLLTGKLIIIACVFAWVNSSGSSSVNGIPTNLYLHFLYSTWPSRRDKTAIPWLCVESHIWIQSNMYLKVLMTSGNRNCIRRNNYLIEYIYFCISKKKWVTGNLLIDLLQAVWFREISSWQDSACNLSTDFNRCYQQGTAQNTELSYHLPSSD